MNNHLMNSEERFVKWKCPECGNYHKWVWNIYDIFGGEITMTCDNPECGATSKMYMVVEKNGNATALVEDNSQVEEKLRRATEKVMNSQTEIDISRVLMDGDIVTIMGEKYKRIEEPKTPVEEAYKRWMGEYPPTTPSVDSTDDIRWRAYQMGYNASKVSETPQEPEELKTLYQMWNDGECRDDICYLVKEWMSQYADNVLRGECKKGYEYCLTVLEENLKND